MKKLKNQTKQIIGFGLEIIFFVSTGYALCLQRYTITSIFLALAFCSAIWTGEQIKQEVREGDEEMKKIFIQMKGGGEAKRK